MSDRYDYLNFGAHPQRDHIAEAKRLTQFVGGKHPGYNLSALIYADYKDRDIEVICWDAPGRSKPTFKEAKKELEEGNGEPINIGYRFGPSWTQHWLRISFKIPKEWGNAEQVELIFDPSCEAMVFDSAGNALQGITGGFDYNRRVEYIIPKEEVKKGRCVRYIEVSANGVFGTDSPARDDKYYTLATIAIGSVNFEARRLMWDFETLKALPTILPPTSPLANKAQTTANAIMNTFDQTTKSLPRCRKVVESIMGKNWEKNVIEEMGKFGDKQHDGNLWALGYCHIDTAWLWPWSATQQKVARTWSSQIDLSDRYPEFRFMASAAQHYSWLEKFYPDLFEKLKRKIKEGKMEVNGGCWVEMDGNLPSGESLCRQFLYGQKYFQSRFGITTDVLVLPDTFGFSPQLPQIARLSGCQSFFTHKLNWNTTNDFPLTTFNWVGLDGSQVLSHITPIGRYDSDCTLPELNRAYERHRNLDVSPDSLILYGHGDGGGGPSQVMLERLRRARATSNESDPVGALFPKVKMGVTLSDFFEHLRKSTDEGRTVPDWNGELYLEKHRAVYTTQSNTKRSFRKSEQLLRHLELFATISSISSRTNYSYPKKEIDELWEALCLCMFHDTLPGSSIRLAVEDYDKKFEWIRSNGEKLLKGALESLEVEGPEEVFVNPLPSIGRREVVVMSNGSLKVADMAKGVVTALPKEVKVKAPQVIENKNGFILKNEYVSLEVKDGRIVSFKDEILNRELIRGDAGFAIYEDLPQDGDAWEIEQWTFDKQQSIAFDPSYKVILRDPLRVSVECTFSLPKSSATITFTLDAIPGSKQPNSRSLIRISTKINWHEKHRLLRFELPLNLYSQEVTCDTAFGIQKRPTHRNTSWEMSKFEISAHKFIDYSELFGYGIAFLNDCKYGYGVQGNKIGISLLRGSTEPDPEADMGEHTFVLGLYPHVGTYAESDVQEVAHAFNEDIIVTKSPGITKYPFILEGNKNVILQGVKRGEEDFDSPNAKSTSVILRLHEHMGGHADVQLKLHGLHPKRALLVDILEREIEEIDIISDMDHDSLDLAFRGFEIKTIKLVL